MATVKVKFRPSTTESKEGTLFYQYRNALHRVNKNLKDIGKRTMWISKMQKL